MRKSNSLLALTLFAFSGTGAFAQAPSGQISQQQMKSYMDALRKDLRTEKQTLVDQAMGLEAGQKAKFWGVYENYQKELSGLWDQRIATIKKYAETYQTMTDDAADQIARAAIKNEQAGSALRAKYYEQFKQAMGGKVAARFLQVETILAYLGTLQIQSEIPLMP